MPKKWKEFEEACCIYLNATYGNEQRLFIHHGGSDSTESDIEFKLNENSHFFIEAKMNASQCGQFVLLPDFERKTFSYSDKNKFPENEHSKEIIEHMNNNFVVFSEAGTAGVSITGANFGLGNVRFYLLDAEGNRACNTSARYTTLQNSIGLTYNSGAALYNNCTVTLVGIREGNTVYVKGNFQP